MQTLQTLFDYYKDTTPSKGKLKEAANVLIHICKAVRVSKPEDIGPDKFENIPHALDLFYGIHKEKAAQDKGIFAEMIGRFGPRAGWEKPFEKLLLDADDNLRQFSLNALEFCGSREPSLIIPYIERTFQSKDILMRTVAAILIGKIYCSGHSAFIKSVILQWKEGDGRLFIQEIYSNLRFSQQNGIQNEACRSLKNWLQQEFNFS